MIPIYSTSVFLKNGSMHESYAWAERLVVTPLADKTPGKEHIVYLTTRNILPPPSLNQDPSSDKVLADVMASGRRHPELTGAAG